MAATPVYLDYNATAWPRPAAIAAVTKALGLCGNPSSVHGFGRAARGCLEDAREAIAALVGATPAAVVFTSGGTEANRLALHGLGRRRILASAVEHPSVLQGGIVETIPVDAEGVVDLAALERLLAAGSEPALVSVMLANNETGVIQPLPAVAELAHRHGALLHGDAVQAFGKIEVDIGRLGVDLLSLSAHKLGGPQGVGALVLADADRELRPLLVGGGQERGRRSGTENLPGIAGFAVAAVEAVAELAERGRIGALRDRLERAIRNMVPSLTVFGAGADRLPNTSCLAVPGLTAQSALMALDLEGIAVSSGSACSSGKVAPSHVLTAMGREALAGSAIRVSLGWASRGQDVDRFVEAFGQLAKRIGSAPAVSAA